MKRLILPGALSAAALLAIAMPPPAFATVDLYATIDKTKDINIVETIEINKDISITASVLVNAIKAAEADTHINQENFANSACSSCAEKLDWINGSINDNTALVSVNQAAGNNNNQGNSVSASVDHPPGGSTPPPNNPPTTAGPSGGFADAQAAVDQTNGVQKVAEPTGDPNNPLTNPVINWYPNIVDSVGIVFREARIDDSINRNTGIVGVNQASGNMANQANGVALAISLSGGVALAEADLGQVNATNVVHERDVRKTAYIDDSVNGNHGLVGVNQSSGNMANQANVMGVSAAIVGLSNTNIQ